MDSDESKDHVNEAEIEGDCGSLVAARSASWPVVAGSLEDTVICDSSLSTSDGGGDCASLKSALLLRRPFPDFSPCEIKIDFRQKHEIRQVYVRSTARVYEIYYAADARSMNEYLCTVRCGMAAKVDELVEKEYTPKMATLMSTSSGSSASSKFLEAGPKTDSNTSTSEDGWVEIKDPDTATTEDGDSCHSDESEVQREREKQDFYEATAEISDANPCTSMTIRLLPIQSSESVYLDEVYVFADPVECEDVNSTTNAMEPSAGASLMSMFIPTLLQLSKERSANQGALQKLSSPSTSVKAQTEETPCVSDNEEVATDRLNCVSDQRTRIGIPAEPSNSQATTGVDLSPSCIGKTLDELVSRIARIEEFCVRFEEKMINPVVNMDARLEKVERQLELLNDKFQLPQTQSSTRFCAPEFSCDASLSNSFSNDDNTNSSSQTPKSFKKDDHISDEVPVSHSGIPTAANGYFATDTVPSSPEMSCPTEPFKHDERPSAEAANAVSDAPSAVSAHLVPSLVVTAPEFSYSDEDEEHDVIKSDTGSPQNKVKKPPSIDDALAFALAGFLSSTSTEQLKTDFDPEISDTDEEARTNTSASERVDFDEPILVLHHMNAVCEVPVQAVASTGELEAPHFSTNPDPKVESTAGEDLALQGESADICLFRGAQDQLCGSEELSADNENVITEKVEVENNSKEAGESSTEVATKVGIPSEEVARVASDLLYSILDSPINSVVDYETPVLNVEFSARERSCTATSLETLLQLSKERSANQGALQKLSSPSTSVKAQTEETPCMSDKEEVATDRLNCVSDQRTRIGIPAEPSNSQAPTGVDLSPSCIGKTLDELVSRIARIEEFCVRFEEKMINPVVNMDARLEKVERQLELLNDKFQLPQTQSSTRFCAPEFSCDASLSNSFSDDDNANSSSQTPGSFKKDEIIIKRCARRKGFSCSTFSVSRARQNRWRSSTPRDKGLKKSSRSHHQTPRPTQGAEG